MRALIAISQALTTLNRISAEGIGDQGAGRGGEPGVVEDPPQEGVGVEQQPHQANTARNSSGIAASKSSSDPALAAGGTRAARTGRGLERDQAGHGLAGLGDDHLLTLRHALQELRELSLGSMNVDRGHVCNSRWTKS